MGTVEMLRGLSDEGLEGEIRGLAARAAVAVCQFLLAVAEYDRRRAWQAWECRDMASWLSWKCGISPVTAREQVRVAHALGGLPLVCERFAAGRLSYSQVRAICRAATPATEATLIEWAGTCTAAQLERITRSYRRCSAKAAQDEARQDSRRFLRFGYDDDGNLTGTFSLPAEAAAVFEAAIRRHSHPTRVADADAERAADPYSAVQADVLVELVTAGDAALNDTDETAGGGSGEPFLVTIITEPAALTQPDNNREGDGDGQRLAHVDDGPGLSDETVRRVACDAVTVEITEDDQGRPLNVGRRTRRINRKLRTALKARDGHCAFPGCDLRHTQAHHIRHWADGGPTNLDNLLSLCPRHHHRLHEGGYRIDRRPDGQIRFIHPNGWDLNPHPDTPPTPQSPCPNVAPYQDGWDGTPLDIHTTTAILCHQDERAADRTPDGHDDSAESDGEPLASVNPGLVLSL